MTRDQRTSLDAVVARLDELAQAANLQTSGPWDVSQALEHCAQSVECSLDGYPQLKPWPVRAFIGPLVARLFLARGRMGHDLAAPIPGADELRAGGDISANLARLRAALLRFRRHDGALHPHFVFGALDKERFAQIHALHLWDHLDALGAQESQ